MGCVYRTLHAYHLALSSAQVVSATSRADAGTVTSVPCCASDPAGTVLRTKAEAIPAAALGNRSQGKLGEPPGISGFQAACRELAQRTRGLREMRLGVPYPPCSNGWFRKGNDEPLSRPAPDALYQLWRQEDGIPNPCSL